MEVSFYGDPPGWWITVDMPDMPVALGGRRGSMV
jgi:hypothetical protein